jgi:sulfite reductase alpha subunit-like flavoprotein
MLSFEHWIDPVRGCTAVPAWEAGDVAELWVENSPEAVSALASRLNLQLDAIVRIEFCHRGAAAALCSEEGDPRLCAPVWAMDAALPEPPRPAASFPQAVSVRTLLARYLAISAAPARGALEALAAYARNPEQTAKLIELAGAEGAKLYHAYITSEARSWADVLHDFDSIDAPLAVLLEHIPRLSPRAFSIASACLPSSRPRLDLAVGIVAWKTPLGSPRMGTASAWLAALREGDVVALCVRRGELRAPSDVPLLLIGPGTGVAPMRALVQAAEAAQSVEVMRTGVPPPRVELFFGCRSQASDHIFGQEFSSREAAAASGQWRGLSLYVPAFSRDGGGPGPGGRAYVQDYLMARADSVRALIASGAHIRIAGSAKRMPADVLEALRNILAGPGGTAADGARAIAMLEKQGRLAIEAWS